MSLLTKKPKTRTVDQVDQDLREAADRRAKHTDPVSRAASMKVIDELLDERLAVTK